MPQRLKPSSFQSTYVRAEARTLHKYEFFCGLLDLGIEVEEGLYALPQLIFDLFPAPLKHMHRHMRLFTVLERDQGVAHFDRFLGRKQPHAVNQCQICHAAILSSAACIFQGRVESKTTQPL
jgi:hypothetical protein